MESIRFILALDDGVLDPIEIPISSFQARLRSGSPSFLSVVVPGNDQYADIAARSDGDLTLTMQRVAAETVLEEEDLCTVDLEEIRIDEGAKSISLTLSGHRTVTYTPASVTLTGSSYRYEYAGRIRHRLFPDMHVQPGDTVTIGDDTYTAGVIVWTVSESNATMEIAQEE
jgi:hypothetical protein